MSNYLTSYLDWEIYHPVSNRLTWEAYNPIHEMWISGDSAAELLEKITPIKVRYEQEFFEALKKVKT